MTPAELAATDRAARRRAQSEFALPLLVEAGAGTGKTAALVARIVCWSLGPGWARAEAALPDASVDALAARVLRRIVAITFTEAAAAEMASRLALYLDDLARGRVPVGVDADLLPAEAARLPRARALLGALEQLGVRTIHAFARRVLAAFPLEAGLHPAFEVDADAGRRAEVVRETLEARLRDAYAEEGDPAWLELAAEGFGPPEVEAALLAFANASLPTDALARDPFPPDAVRAMAAGVATAIDALAGFARPRFVRLGGRNDASRVTLVALEALGAEALALARAETPDLDALCERARQAEEAGTLGRLPDWARGKPNKGELEVLGEKSAELAALATGAAGEVKRLSALYPQRLLQALRVLRPLWSETAAALRARGIASFEDLLRGARDLLRDHPRVTHELRSQMDQLLVDEFQDTDALQCELVRALALDGPANARPALFVVGDPKQSIYGWRSADLAAYFDFRARLEAAGGAVVRLSVNFRSVPAVLDEVERVIAPVMLLRADLQPSFEPLVPSEKHARDPGFREGDTAPVEHWIAWPRASDGTLAPADTVGVATEVEARGIAADVRQLHDAHGVGYREVALLLRSRGPLDVWLDALRDAGVPYAVDGDRTYYERREVIDAAAFVRCVLDRHDVLSLLAALRSSAVGVPDAALIPLWKRGLPALAAKLDGPRAPALASLREAALAAAAELPASIPGIGRLAGFEHALVHFLETLAELRASFAADPADVFVENLRTRLLFEVGEAARVQGAYRLANLERFFRVLARDLGDGAGGAQALLRQLRVRVQEALAAEEARPEEAVEDAVRVLTIHQAKGLDFAHVYAVALHQESGSGGSARDPAVWIRGDRAELRVFGAPTLGWADANAQRKELAIAESVRTLYVASTRAKRRLVLSARWPASAPTGTHLELVQSRSGGVPDLSELAARLTAEGSSYADELGARWVFPALRPQALEPGEREDSAALATDEEVREDAHRLRELGAEAEQRMARAHGAAASAESHAALEALFAAESGPGGAEQRIALAVGSGVHAWLEHTEFGAPARDRGAARSALERSLASRLTEDEAREALALAQDVLERLERGPLAERLAALRARVVARELAFVAPPRDGDASAPVESIAGSIDLVYRDPEDGRLVVADWKTDRVEAGPKLDARAAAYASQVRTYAEALRSGLGLDYLPRFELWFLAAGRVISPAG